MQKFEIRGHTETLVALINMQYATKNASNEFVLMRIKKRYNKIEMAMPVIL